MFSTSAYLLVSRLVHFMEAFAWGGAVFLFLRGIANVDTRGCCVLGPDLELLDGLDALLGMDGEE